MCAALLVRLSPLFMVILGVQLEAIPRQPTGYFVIQRVGGQNVSDAKLSSPKWDGILIRERWAAIEPAEASYDWTFIDEQVARAKKYKKKYMLGINTGNNAPGWLGVPLYQEAPYPWDPTMLSAHARMVKKLGERYSNDPGLVGVCISGPTRGPSGSLEMQLAVGLTRQEGYSEERIIAAWKGCIDQYAEAFPDCALISKGGVAPGGGRATISQAVFDYLFTRYPDRANVSHCALKAGTREHALHHKVVVEMGRRGCRVGFEMVGPSAGGKNGQKGSLPRFGGPFQDALLIAERANAQWLTVYQADERNLPD